MELTFYGAAGTVTGSKFLLKTEQGLNILIDCGMYQGETDPLNKLESNMLPFNAEDIDYVLLTHAHIDHSGLLPLLAKKGFRGTVYCTAPTLDLIEMMLYDSAYIQAQDLKYINRARQQKELPEIEALYSPEDVALILDKTRVLEEGRTLNLHNHVFVKQYNNGHIIGSVGFHVSVKEKGNQQTSLYFTGDIGRKNDPILRDPIPFTQADYIICESTYGDRIHPPVTDVEPMLLNLIYETCVEKKGKIVIPAFSVDRTQEIIYLIDRMHHFGKLPKINVYIDSPMSVRATRIIKKHVKEFNPQILEYISKDGDPFCFPNLHYIESIEESKAIDSDPNPGIIISASGMAEAGRVKHHIKNLIHDPNNLLLFVGYATPHSLAGKIKSGAENVRIFGEYFDVKARVASLDYFSAHADYQEMIEYLSCLDPSMVKGLFLVHGRDETRLHFANRLRAVGYNTVHLPKLNDSYILNTQS